MGGMKDGSMFNVDMTRAELVQLRKAVTASIRREAATGSGNIERVNVCLQALQLLENVVPTLTGEGE